MSLNDDFEDEVIARAIILGRFAASERRTILRLHRAMERELVAWLEEMDVTGVAAPYYKRRRMEKLLVQSRQTIAAGYREIRDTHLAGMVNLAADEASWLMRTSEAKVGINLFSVALSSQQLREIGRDTLISGAPSREWWSRQSAGLQRRFSDQVRLGVLQGEPTDQIVRRTRGTKAEGFRNGIMETSRREAEALVRTSVQTVANEARTQMYQENQDVVKGIQWVATLDSRTTLTCMTLDGKQWSLPDYEPVGHARPYPGPTAHWGCRSTQTPVLKSFQELAGGRTMPSENGGRTNIEAAMKQKLRARGWSEERIEKAVANARASMDGQVPASMNFDTWLSRQSQARQNAILGTGRADLYRRGEITLNQLVDQTGRPRTLDQLREN